MTLEHDLQFSEGKYSKISLELFQKITANQQLQEVFKKNEQLEKKKIENLKNNFRNNVAKVGLDQLIYLKELGEGQFGDVCLVTTVNDHD